MARKKPAKPGKPARTIVAVRLHGLRLWSLGGLAVLALAISGYLAWGWFAGQRLPGCGPDSGCDAVLNTRWGYWFGLPVSLGALAAYAAVLGIVARLSRPLSAPARARLELGLLGIALVVLGAALWFTGLQLFVIRAICPYCMTAHACGAAMAVLVILWGRARYPADLLRGHEPGGARLLPDVNRLRLRWAVLGAAAAMVVLVAGQVLYRPPSFRVQAMDGSRQAAAATAPAGPTAGSGSKTDPRFLELYSGLFRFNLGEVPLLGSPDAPHVLVSLFDYTCSHCRAAHLPLVETQRTLSNQLAIVSLPVPLDRACNPTVRRPLPAHTNACIYARLGLAVWRADRQQAPAFDDWLFATPQPPSTRAAYEEARRLVGTNALAQALKDRWVDDLIAQNARLHRTNALRYGKGQLPQLILGGNLAVGSFDDTPRLLDFVRRQLAPSVSAPGQAASVP